MQGTATVDGNVAAEAMLMCKMIDKPLEAAPTP
jgi:hypothetical protein